METQTIKEIKEIKDSVVNNIDDYKRVMKSEPNIDMNTPQFGSESEYSINGLIGGVKNILTDISFLVRAYAFFIKISTYDERRNIKTQIINLNSYIQNRNHAQIAVMVDSLKLLLRPYNLRLDKDRFLDFNNEIDSLRRKAVELEDVIGQAKQKIENSNIVYNEITDSKELFDKTLEKITTKKDELIQTVDEFTGKYEDFTNLAENAKENESTISAKLDKIKEYETEFNDFIVKIEEREDQLKKQGEKFKDYDEKVSTYKNVQDILQNEAENLIDKSKTALGYTTSVSLSTAFSKQYSDANKYVKTIPWLVGAGIFILFTIGIGIWILTGWGIDPSSDTIIKIVGRLSLIPFTLLSALFCANQYIKQKNIIEDYAYKSVLAKSMIAFSEELRTKDNERYAEYISTVLKEIHQDPLRRRDKEKKEEVSLNDSISTLSKIIELVKPIINNK